MKIIISNTMLNDCKMLIFHFKYLQEQTEYLSFPEYLYVCSNSCQRTKCFAINIVKSHFEKNLSIKQVFP